MYEINAFFWYKAVFMVELLIAETFMVFRLKRRKLFALRAVGAVTFCIGLAFAMPVLHDGAFFAAFMYSALFIATLLAIWFCFDVRIRTVVFCGLVGYATQHLSFELFDIATILMGVHNMTEMAVGSNPVASFLTIVYGSGNAIIANAFVVTVYISILFITYWAIARVALPRLGDAEKIELKNGTMLVIFALTIVFDIVISAVITEYSNKHFDSTYVILADIANIFCCVLALYMQFGMAKMRKLDSEIDTLNKMWEQSKQQYVLTKQNIDMINFKCHDLKHQIRRMGAKNELNPLALEEMERLISAYDSDVKTGNSALDVILTEKSLYCNHNGISLSCMADGKQLDFMNESDIYSVFGNMIDNAIEAVQKLDDDSKVIGISVKRIKDFVFVNVNNFYNGEIKFHQGLPLSTKGDNMNHGFGVKSVKMIVESYGGELKVTAENGIFNTDLIFPR
jgi:hypothetical protein